MKRTVRCGEFAVTVEAPDDEGVKVPVPTVQVHPETEAIFERMVQAAGGYGAVDYVASSVVYFRGVNDDANPVGWAVAINAPPEMLPVPVPRFEALIRDRRLVAERAAQGDKAATEAGA